MISKLQMAYAKTRALRYEPVVLEWPSNVDANLYIHILCHDDESEARSHRDFPPYFLKLRLENHIFLETAFYMHHVRVMTFPDGSWVGTLSHRALDKINKTKIVMFLKMNRRNLDAVALMPIRSNFVSQMESHHAGLVQIFDELLLQMGEDPSLLRSPQLVPFYCNYWVARLSVVRAYSDWLQEVNRTINQSIKLQEMLNQPSHYGSWDPKKTQEIYGLPYLPLHAFLGERLVCYFFYSRGIRLCAIN